MVGGEYDRAPEPIAWCVSCRVHIDGSASRLAFGTLVDRLHLEQGEPEGRDALQQPLELGLVTYVAGQLGVARGLV